MAINENRLYVLGFSHQKIPLSIREKIILTDDIERELRLLLNQKAKEFLFLETCNRFEIYYVSSEIKLEQELLGLFKHFSQTERSGLIQRLSQTEPPGLFKRLSQTEQSGFI